MHRFAKMLLATAILAGFGAPVVAQPSVVGDATTRALLGQPLPQGDLLVLPTSVRERFNTLPYRLFQTPYSNRPDVAEIIVDEVEDESALPTSFRIQTFGVNGACEIVLPLIRPGEEPIERRLSILVVDTLDEAYRQFLENTVRLSFPTANVNIRVAGGSTAIVTGTVEKAEDVTPIIRLVQGFLTAQGVAGGSAVAEPNVVNALLVSGSHQVQLRVIVAEVNRSRLRQLGFDFLYQDLGGGLQALVQSRITPLFSLLSDDMGLQVTTDDLRLTGQFGVVRQGVFSFSGFLQAVEANNLGKILAEPVLVTTSGQPAFFNSGGELPVPEPQGLGTVAITFRPFGINIRFVPIVLGNGKIRLDVRPEVSDISIANGIQLAGSTIPGFTSRVAETTVEIDNGQTLAIAGLKSHTVQAERRKVPFFGDLPAVGWAFQFKGYNEVETELLIIVTPHLIAPLNQPPVCLPGMESRVPNDIEYYLGGKFEPPCFADPYRGEWKRGAHGHRIPPAPKVGPYDSWGRPAPEFITPPPQMTPAGSMPTYSGPSSAMPAPIPVPGSKAPAPGSETPEPSMEMPTPPNLMAPPAVEPAPETPPKTPTLPFELNDLSRSNNSSQKERGKILGIAPKTRQVVHEEIVLPSVQTNEEGWRSVGGGSKN